MNTYCSVRAADEPHARIRLAEITSRLHATLGLVYKCNSVIAEP